MIVWFARGAAGADMLGYVADMIDEVNQIAPTPENIARPGRP